MKYFNVGIAAVFVLVSKLTNGEQCDHECPATDATMVCGFDPTSVTYKMFASKCTLDAFAKCYGASYIETPLKYCISHDVVKGTRRYGFNCPTFCPEHYRPVCAASNWQSYVYRTFKNGCFLDMISCRGQDMETNGYTEVPLSFCQKHSMLNIFKTQVIGTNIHDYVDNM